MAAPSTVNKLVRIAFKPLGLVLYLLSGLVPRDRNRWVIGSWHGHRFADNAKWLFAHLTQNEPAIRTIWISRNPTIVHDLRAMGYEAYLTRSLRGLWACLRAGVYAYDVNVGDINFYTSRGAFRINLWHGTPLKRIERDINTPGHPARREFHGPWLRRKLYYVRAPWIAMSPDLVIAASPYAAPHMASAFAVPQERAPITGMPRNDILLASKESPFPADHAWHDRLAAWKERRESILVYMPTFRDTKRDRALPLDWHTLQTWLAEQGAHLLLKLHPHDAAQLPDLDTYENLHLLDTAADPYPILRHADVLITDYSSVFFDFLVLDRPIVFYAYDLEEYKRADRGLYIHYEDATPGYHAHTTAALLPALRQALQDRHSGVDRGSFSRASAAARFAPTHATSASARVVAEVRRASASR